MMLFARVDDLGTAIDNYHFKVVRPIKPSLRFIFIL
jgi:hypothetical protein